MAHSSIRSFDRLVSRFLKERRFHLEAVEEIDAIFAKHGITPSGHREGTGLPGGVTRRTAHTSETPKSASKVRRRRKRGSFAETATEFILAQLKGKGATTSAINKAWKASGRGGTSDNNLSILVKAKKIKRTKNAEGMGSTYTAG